MWNVRLGQGGGETSGIWIAKSFRKQSLGGTRWKCERNIKQTLYLVAVDGLVVACEISSFHGGEYDVQSCILGYTAV
jgi:hypothetical protein